MMNKGDLIQTWYDEGCGSGGYVYGLVIKSGPKTFTVKWESGLVQRREHGHKACMLIPNSDRNEAIKALGLS